MKNILISLVMVISFITSMMFGLNVFAYQERRIDTQLLPYQLYAYTTVGDQIDVSKQYFEAKAISSTSSNFSANACIDKRVWWGWDRASHFIYLDNFDEYSRGDFGRRHVGSGTALSFAIQNGSNESNTYGVEVIVKTN